ncbi:MAG: hypothetical protein QE280_09710 [Caulobacter sp.]|jgi:hypothetical protein|nr:hypothetical protein [Caulobacter sp.]
MDESGKPGDRQRLFLIETGHEADSLIRILRPFATQEAQIIGIRLDRQGEGQSILIEARGVSDERAAVIARQLEALVSVRSIGLGWKSMPTGDCSDRREATIG